MSPHPYLRAYMSGIFVPTIFLVVVLSVFVVLRVVLQIPVPIERVIVFPMAVVPNAWGLWNMLFVRVHRGRYNSIGLHGALFPVLIAPTAALVAVSLGILQSEPGGIEFLGAIHPSYGTLAVIFCMAVGVYYLVWKYAVGALNELLGIA